MALLSEDFGLGGYMYLKGYKITQIAVAVRHKRFHRYRRLGVESVQHDSDRRALIDFRVEDKDTSVVVPFDDAFTQRETQAPTAGLCRKARFENAFEVAFGHPFAGIFDVDVDPVVIG